MFSRIAASLILPLSFSVSAASLPDVDLERQAKKFDEEIAALAEEAQDSDFMSVEVLEKEDNYRKVRISFTDEDFEKPVPLMIEARLGAEPVITAQLLPGGTPVLSQIIEKMDLHGDIKCNFALQPENFSFTSNEAVASMPEKNLKVGIGALDAKGVVTYIPNEGHEEQEAATVDISASLGSSAAQTEEGYLAIGKTAFEFKSRGKDFTGSMKSSGGEVGAEDFEAVFKNVSFIWSGDMETSEEDDASFRMAFGCVSLPLDDDDDAVYLTDGSELYTMTYGSFRLEADSVTVTQKDEKTLIAKPAAAVSFKGVSETGFGIGFSADSFEFSKKDAMAKLAGGSASGYFGLKQSPSEEDGFELTRAGGTVRFGSLDVEGEGVKIAVRQTEVSGDAKGGKSPEASGKIMSAGGEGKVGSVMVTLGSAFSEGTLKPRGDLFVQSTKTDIKNLNVFVNVMGVQVPSVKIENDVFFPDSPFFREKMFRTFVSKEICESFPSVCLAPEEELTQEQAQQLFLESFWKGKVGFDLKQFEVNTTLGTLTAAGSLRYDRDDPQVGSLSAVLNTTDPFVAGLLEQPMQDGWVVRKGPNTYASDFSITQKDKAFIVDMNGTQIQRIPFSQFEKDALEK